MNSKLKNILLPLLACVFLFPWVLVKCERNKNESLKYDNKLLEANIAALGDSVRITKTKNGQLEYNRLSLISDNQGLQKLNQSLFAEVQNTKGKVVIIQKAGINIVSHDTIYAQVDPNQADSCDFVVGLDKITNYSPGNYRKRQGYVAVNKDTAYAVINDEIGLTATTGLKKNDKGDFEIFFRSPYPNLTITSLEGAYIPKNQLVPPIKKKHFGVGFILGYSPLTYKFNTKKLTLENQLTAGFGITYKF